MDIFIENKSTNIILNFKIVTEDNPVTSTFRASESAGRVILRVRESVRAPRLEKPRQIRRPARPRMAAVLRRFVHRTWVVASPRRSQFVRALTRDIRRASNGSGAPVRGGPEFKRHVEPFHNRDVVVVFAPETVEPVFGESVGRGAVGLALELPVAVSGQAAAPAGGVEGAVSSGPDFCEFGSVGEADGPGLAAVEAAASAWHGCSPDGVGAVVLDVEDYGMGVEEEKGEEKNEDGFGEVHIFFSGMDSGRKSELLVVRVCDWVFID
ncbi:hypothetical protein Pfo_010336 [Paulownia fortunei]|nr:hypothetical protein Pfo_010336 [Paulownia fortunei]